MEDSSDALSDLLNRVIEGEPVDWARAALACPDAKSRARLTALIELEAIARLADPHPAPGPAEVESHATGVGRAWGPLELRRLIRAEDDGVRFEAWDPQVERRVDLRLISVQGWKDEELDATLQTLQRLASLSSPHLPLLYGATIQDGELGIWREHIEGMTLEELVARYGPLSGDEACLIGGSVCQAFAALHAEGLGCGDVTPRSVVRERGGRVVVTGFRVGRQGESGDSNSRDTGSRTAQPSSDMRDLGRLLQFLLGADPATAPPNSWGGAAEPNPGAPGHTTPEPGDLLRAVIARALGADPKLGFVSAREMERALAELIRRRSSP